MQTTITQASIADQEALFDFIRAAYGDQAKYKIPERWKWQFRDNPFLDVDAQKLSIWIAVKDDQIVGQICAMPVEIKIGDEIRRASWGADLFVLPICRGGGVGRRLIQAVAEHYKMYMSIHGAAASRRIYKRLGAIEIVPVRRCRRFVKLNRDSIFRYLMTRLRQRPRLKWIARIGCRVFLFDAVFSLAVNVILGFRNLFERQIKKKGRTQIREIERFGDEIDQLWNATKHQFEVIVKRDQRFLNWRFTGNTQLNYRSFIATRDSETKGYIVLRKHQPVELGGGVIADLYASRDDEETLEDLIRHAIHFFGQEVAAIECATTLKEYQKVLSRLGFREAGTRNPLCFCTNSALHTKIDELKNSWFLSKADHDWELLWPP